RLALPPALCAGVMIGTLSAWLARHSAPPAADASPPASAPAPLVETQPVPSPLRPIQVPGLAPRTAPPFEILERAVSCTTLRQPLAAAQDGDTILIHGRGPFVTGPLEVRGKSLTLRAAPGARPALVRGPAHAPAPGQALLATDRALTLEGIDL